MPTGIMTSKMMPGAGDVSRGSHGGFQYSHPIVQLYDNPYSLLDRFQLMKLSERLNRPIKTQITRGLSNMPGTDKLVAHFVALEGTGHIRRENIVPMIEQILRDAEDAKRVPLNEPEHELELALPDPAPNTEVLRIAQLDLVALKAEAHNLGVTVNRGDKRKAIVDRVFAALGVSV